MGRVVTFRCYGPDRVESGLAQVEYGWLRAIAKEVSERVFHLAMWAYGRGLLLVLLCVPRLPYFVKDKPDATRLLCNVFRAKIEEFSAEVVRGVSEQIAMGGPDEVIADVLLEVLFGECVV